MSKSFNWMLNTCLQFKDGIIRGILVLPTFRNGPLRCPLHSVKVRYGPLRCPLRSVTVRYGPLRSVRAIRRTEMKVDGKLKDECKGQLMLRLVGLRPKLYSIDYEREAHFECKNGIAKQVRKPTDTSVTRIVLENKNTAKGVKGSAGNIV